MTPYSFNYHKATSVEDAIAQRQQHGEEAKFVAGGHSLIPAMKLRLSGPSALIDLQGLDELKAITDDGSHVHIGALATHRMVETSSVVQGKCPALAQAAGGIGDPQVRNKGTIGGSLAHADPSADYPALVLALGATVTVQGPNGTRSISADDYFTGMFDTALDDAEMITRVSFPVTGSGQSAAYAKFPNPASRYAVVGVAAYIEKDDRGICTSARIGITGAADTAFRASTMEQALVGKPFNADAIAAASSNLPDADDLLSDLSASASYRAHLCGVMAKRALTACM